MTLEAHRCPNGHLSYPGHPRCPECAEPQEGTVDLTDRTAEVVTWTTSTATPPGVRAPNHLAIVEFEVDDESVRVIGGLTVADSERGSDGRESASPDVEIGDEVRPVHVEELRDPAAGIREEKSQRWDGYRFEPV